MAQNVGETWDTAMRRKTFGLHQKEFLFHMNKLLRHSLCIEVTERSHMDGSNENVKRPFCLLLHSSSAANVPCNQSKVLAHVTNCTSTNICMRTGKCAGRGNVTNDIPLWYMKSKTEVQTMNNNWICTNFIACYMFRLSWKAITRQLKIRKERYLNTTR
jgi:hypothetical protein